jgi:membrane protease YdiL (CAAX protease family)
VTLAPPRSPRFEAFVAPARARPALWRLLIGSAIAAAAWFGSVLLLFFLFSPAAGGRAALVLYLLSFAGLAAGTALAARLHGRSARTLLGPGGFRPRAFFAGIAVLAVLAGLGALPLLFADAPVRQAPLAVWLAWLPLALPALLVQTAAEELAFRGYLMQALAARFRSALAWWLLPALLFGLLHWDPEQFGRHAWLAAASAGVVGLVLADVTARTGNLSAAIGLHFANNGVALLLVAVSGPASALGLWLHPLDPADPDATLRFLLADLAATLVAWAAWRLVVRARPSLHSPDPGSI